MNRGVLGGLDQEEHLRDPAKKQRYVTSMFDTIAPRYDRFTRLFSFGMDARWKRLLLDESQSTLATAALVLDVACGTGDFAFALASRVPGATIVGLDVSSRMIDAAIAKRQSGSAPHDSRDPEFVLGDMARLPIRAATVDLVMAGYALRNAPDFEVALREIARVLRPGGRLLTLDFYRPTRRMMRALYLGYLSAAGAAVGWLWHREPDVYRYIARSIDHFVSFQSFSDALRAAGFEVERETPKLWGGVALHGARRI